jgi:DNA primase
MPPEIDRVSISGDREPYIEVNNVEGLVALGQFAALSPRARDGAPVSMPLTWTQVRKGLDPKRFTIQTTPRLLKATAAWEDYCQTERSLKAAVKKLLG